MNVQLFLLAQNLGEKRKKKGMQQERREEGSLPW